MPRPPQLGRRSENRPVVRESALAAYVPLIPPILVTLLLIAGGVWYFREKTKNDDTLAALETKIAAVKTETGRLRAAGDEMNSSVTATVREIERLNRERAREALAKANEALRELESSLRTTVADGERKLAEIARAAETTVRTDTGASDNQLREANAELDKITRDFNAVSAEVTAMKTWLKTHNRTMHRSY